MPNRSVGLYLFDCLFSNNAVLVENELNVVWIEANSRQFGSNQVGQF